MIPRTPKSPSRIGVPTGMFPAVSATAAASVAPNYLAAARACCAAAEMHQPTPSTHRNRRRTDFAN
eukprot:951893-Pyramimonas_sp.AAC.1